MQFRRRLCSWWRVLLAITVLAVCLSPPVRQLTESPSEVWLPLGDRADVVVGWKTFRVNSSDPRVVEADVQTKQRPAVFSLIGKRLGEAYVSTKVFSILPWKAVRVEVVPQQIVYVGGQSVGIRMKSHGVMVIGYQHVGGQNSPAAQSHVEIGDVIERLNGVPLTSADDLQRLLARVAPRDVLTLTIRRHGQVRTVRVQPVQDKTGRERLGLFVRDRTSGVGTLTFYDPDHHRFGALGHIITDVDTGQPIDGQGTVYPAEVIGMIKGTAGHPGEKRGRFVSPTTPIGEIDKNTAFGIFGNMQAPPPNLYLQHEVPVALPSQIHDGPAQLLTVVSGETVEAFQVQVENIQSQTHPATKSMVIRVTDPRLLKLTGGIVQGMSGSPILQDGRLIGAVTHVFVSDPTRGYGVYARWMMQECQSEGEEDGKEIQAAFSPSRFVESCRMNFLSRENYSETFGRTSAGHVE
ncbi:MAG: SpoIVB peptidase [Alicyclobacillus herbarius]|uniref:SpoIVB peptidase n=1 Tax=Alicyclobacillus herbarius TaxID=122960 RepID=UPI0006857138|nr:SpoIVB peptidase [Alicyclobacillus herbarius]MCL6633633.1 SpoIVB peptidase [Alicyclobacillus herbarius]